jgi:hypothetical protein
VAWRPSGGVATMQRLLAWLGLALALPASAILWADATGRLPGPPFSARSTLANLVEAYDVVGFPVSFVVAAWFFVAVAISSVNRSRFDIGVSSDVDRVIFYTAIPLMALITGTSLFGRPTPWLTTSTIVPVAGLFVLTGVRLDNARRTVDRSERTERLIDHPSVVLGLTGSAVAAFVVSILITLSIRAGGTMQPLERRLAVWLDSRERAQHPLLVPPSGVRLVAIISERTPAGWTQLLALHRAVASSHKQAGANVEWIEAVVPADGRCLEARLGDEGDCQAAEILAFFLGQERHEEVRALRADLEAQLGEKPDTVARRSLATAGQIDAFEQLRPAIAGRMRQYQQLLGSLGNPSLPSLFVNGIQAASATPDLLDLVIEQVLARQEAR